MGSFCCENCGTGKMESIGRSRFDGDINDKTFNVSGGINVANNEMLSTNMAAETLNELIEIAKDGLVLAMSGLVKVRSIISIES